MEFKKKISSLQFGKFKMLAVANSEMTFSNNSVPRSRSYVMI